MNISFENKVALVTGAASGLGLATAKAFAESGASVVLADWNEKEVQSASKSLADKGHRTFAIRCDVSDDAQVEAMVKRPSPPSVISMRPTTTRVFKMCLSKRPTIRAMIMIASWRSICVACGVV